MRLADDSRRGGGVDSGAVRALAGRIAAASALVLTAAACGAGVRFEPARAATPPRAGVVRIVLGGDTMLGRAVTGVRDPLAGLRPVLAAADLAAVNLESPLTSRRHDPAAGPNALEARPRSAVLLASAGIDAADIANNHAGDAGPATVADTLAALRRAGVAAVGAAPAHATVLRAGRLRVAFLAFDATGETPHGVAAWNADVARRTVAAARAHANVVIVGLHAGVEYDPVASSFVLRVARLLAADGADVVWGHGPHVTQGIRVLHVRRSGRPTVVATSLGDLVFDQHAPGTRRGTLLEVVAGRDGIRAFRVGRVAATPHARFLSWRAPSGNAVALGGDWWTLVPPVDGIAPPDPRPAAFPGHVVATSLGDAEGTGDDVLAIAFRRPARPTLAGRLVPRRTLVDRDGLTAHVGLYRPTDLHPLWVAGTLYRPVSALAACDGALAVAYSLLDEPSTVAAGAWRWGGFGFTSLPALPGPGRPACVDIDGRLDAAVLERSAR